MRRLFARRGTRQVRYACVLGLGIAWFALMGCRTSGYTVVGSGGGVQVGPIELELRSFRQRLPCFTHQGQVYVVGRRGMPYSIWIRNLTAQRLEVVVSVDGRNVINGRPQQRRYRGYILNPYRYVDITGYRTSLSSVATFRFSALHRSYASRKGSSWFRVGSIMVSVYNERGRKIYGRPLVQPRHYSRSPSILRQRGYARTPPHRGSRPSIIVTRRKRLDSFRSKQSHGVARPRYRRPATPRFTKRRYAPPPVNVAPRPAPVPGGSDDSMSKRPSRPVPSGKSFGGASSSYRRDQRRRTHRESRQNHRYHYPAPPEGLGTSFGERRYSRARFTTFVRATHHPSYVLKIMYNNCAAYRYIGLCTPWCPCYSARPAPQPMPYRPDPSVP